MECDDECVACANCDWHGAASECDEYQDFWSRVEPGEIIPHGDCPKCGAFCYAIEEAWIRPREGA